MADSGRERVALGDVFGGSDSIALPNTLCTYLAIADIIALTRTCKSLSSLYRTVVHSQWNIDERLAHYFEDPLRFRAQMAKYAAVINGAFAVSFLERMPCYDFALDIVVSDFGGRSPMADYLEQVEHYSEKIPGSEERIKYDLNLLGDWLFSFYVSPNGRRCRLFSVVRPPLQAVLHASKATLLTNFICHDGAASLFPSPTFLQHCYYRLEPFRTFRPEEQRVWERWSNYGWNEAEGSTNVPPFDVTANPKRRTRYPGDRYSWVIPLPPVSQTENVLPSLIENYVFRIDVNPSSDLTTSASAPNIKYRYTIELSTVVAVTFRRAYTAPEVRNPPSWSWARYLRKKIYEAAREDFEKMDQQGQNEALLALKWLELGTLDTRYGPKPKGWRFVDELIHGWYLEWQEIDFADQITFKGIIRS